MQLSLNNRIALVTGANGGLGAHFATTLARAGASVVLAARRPATLQATRDAIERMDARVCAVALDVTDPASVRAAFDQAQAQLGPIDVLVNNAGIAVTKPLLDLTPDDWDSVLSVNLSGAFHVAQEAARRMKDSGNGGSIVNIASILGLRVAQQLPGYSASKAALIQLTKAMALELARYRIRVNALAPGYIKTGINDTFFETDAGLALIKRVPQRRLGELTDLDGPLLLLASDAGAYMTGAVLAVDGGHLVSTL
jgi:NAD(P)-dependent dehydrogenase (short-subunit alcohol dehydrogenase family)